MPDLEPAPREGTLRFAHLSDPHLSSLAGVSPWTLRDKRLLGWLSWRRRRQFRHLPEILQRVVDDIDAAAVQHRVVTGDLTQIGLHSELQAARRWLATLGDPSEVTVIPGNHDRYVRDPAQRLEALWEPWLQGDQASPGAPSLRLRGPVAFIGLDSAVASPPAFATGALGEPQLRACADLLAATGRAGYCRIVLIHHAPEPGGDRWRKRLVDAPALTAILRAQGAELVLHGHGHRSRLRLLEREGVSIPIASAPSASARDAEPERRAGWNLVTVRRDPTGVLLTIAARVPGAGEQDLHTFEFPSPAGAEAPASARP
ncbi:MAG: metallophosphoesterase [Pseudomonadales bacterium]|jgi:3',5'-cyclic AMP phosphodiesterase CpdA|nr:metallophosphoesterase [Pseudomonadales bacterium]